MPKERKKDTHTWGGSTFCMRSLIILSLISFAHCSLWEEEEVGEAAKGPNLVESEGAYWYSIICLKGKKDPMILDITNKLFKTWKKGASSGRAIFQHNFEKLHAHKQNIILSIK